MSDYIFVYVTAHRCMKCLMADSTESDISSTTTQQRQGIKLLAQMGMGGGLAIKLIQEKGGKGLKGG